MAGKQFSIGYVFTGDGSGLERTIDQLGQTLGGFTKGALGTFIARTLTIGGALMVAEKAMKATEKGSDTLEAAIQGVSGAFQGFFRSVTTGDWDQLFNNIVRTAKATRDLAIAKDTLTDIEASDTVKIGFLQRSLESAKLAAAGTTDPALKAQYIQEAINTQKAITAVEVDQFARRLKVTEDFFTTRENWTKEEADFNIAEIRKIAGNYEFFFGPNSSTIEALKAQLALLKERQSYTSLTPSQETERRRLTLALGSLEIFQKLQETMKPDEFKEYVKTIGEFNAAIAQGDQDLIRLTKTLTKAEDAVAKFKKSTDTPDKIYLFNKTNALGSAQGRAPEQVKQTSEELVSQIEIVNKLEQTFQAMFTNVGGGFKGMINAMMDSLAMLFAQLVAKAAFFAILQLLFPGTPIAANALSGLKKFVGIPGFANGTNFAPGGLALVGERGPELINLPRGSSVTPIGYSGGEKLVAVVRGTDLNILLQRTQRELSINT